METRRLTRSQAAQLGLTPTKEVFLESAKKPSARKSIRKALADKTNEKDDSPVSGLTCMVSKGGNRSVFEGTPVSKLRPLSEAGLETPGEEVLRSQVQSLLSESSEEASSPDIQSLFTGVLSTLTPVQTAHGLSQFASSPQPSTPARLFVEAPITADEPEVTSSKVTLSPCTVNRQSEDEVSPHLYMLGRSPACLATVEEEESESCVTEPDEDLKEVTCNSDRAGQSESYDEENRESSSDEASGCSEVVDASPPGARQDEASSGAAVTRDSVPTQWQQCRAPKKVRFEGEPSEDDEGFGEESVEYEGGELEEECDELCRGLRGISVHERSGGGLPEFSGSHVRFNYNSDDEMEEEEEEVCKEVPAAPKAEPKSPKQSPVTVSLMCFKRLPTPKGKHFRFTQDVDSPARR